jgi:predicted metal-dependent hydrolase
MFKRLFRSYPKPTAKQERYQHPRLGEITLNHSGRACRLSISVRPNGSVRLTIPPGQNLNKALRFLDEKSDWIERARTRQMQRHAQHPIAPPFSTRHHTLQLYPDNNAKIRIRISQGVIASTTHHHYHTIPKRYRRPSIKVLKRHGESKHKITCLTARITLQNS